MKLKFTFLLLLAGSLAGIKAQSPVKYIPDNASSVIGVNIPRISKRFDLNQLHKLSFLNGRESAYTPTDYTVYPPLADTTVAVDEAWRADSTMRANDSMVALEYTPEPLVDYTTPIVSSNDQRLFNNIIKELPSSGMSLAANCYIFTESFDTVTYTHYLIPLSDEARFKTMVEKNISDMGIEAALFKGSNCQGYAIEGLSICWNGSYVISSRYTVTHDYYFDYYNSDYYQKKDDLQRASDSVRTLVEARDVMDKKERAMLEETLDSLNNVINLLDQEQDEIRLQAQQAKEKRILDKTKEHVDNLFNLPADKSILSNANFMGQEKMNYDINYWQNYKYVFMPEVNRRGMVIDDYDAYMKDMARLFDNIYYHVGFNIGDTMMTVKGQVDLNEELGALVKGVYRTKFNKSFYKYIKGDELVAIGYAAINTQKAGESMFKLLNRIYSKMPGGYMGAARAGVQLMELLLDKEVLYKTFTGDLCLAFTGLEQRTYSYTDYDYDSNFNAIEVVKEKTEMVPEFVGLLSVGNQVNARKFLDIIAGLGGLMPLSENVYKFKEGPKGFDIYLRLEKDILIITNSDTMVSRDFKGFAKNEQIPSALRKKLEGHAYVYYMDGRRLNQFMTDTLKHNDESLMAVMKNFGSLYYASESSSGNTVKSTGQVTYRSANIDDLNALYEVFRKMTTGSGLYRLFR